MKPRRYFITATGTGVGKTFTTCALIHAAKKAGIHVSAKKPVLSGGIAAPSDATEIAQALGSDVFTVTRWPFAAALSPHRAAALEDAQIPFDELVAWSAGEGNVHLVEGVGGVMVPLDNTHTVVHWMQALGYPVILVAGSYLGTISHTLSALKVLEMAGLEVAALVVSETAESQVTLAETMRGLAPFIGHVPRCVAQPRVASAEEAHEIHALLEGLP
ncbi:MAG: dethiobiotin synthase [Rickettsiales bacterium]